MESIPIVFDTKKNELSFMIGDEELVIPFHLKGTNDERLTTLAPHAQEKLIKKLVQNITLK